MELVEAIRNRYSVRAFSDQPVKKSVIEEILTHAVRSPSWGNTQPWEVAVAGGPTARNLAEAFAQNILNGVPPCPDFAMPDKFVDEFMDRYRNVGREVFRLKGIGRDDKQARMDHYVNNFRGFGAPNLIYLLLDTRLETVYPIFDAGLLAAHICLLAVDRGLGTCLLAALTMYPDLTRQHLNLGPEKRVALGLAIGYPLADAPINSLRTPREPLERNVTFVDMD